MLAANAIIALCCYGLQRSVGIILSVHTIGIILSKALPIEYVHSFVSFLVHYNFLMIIVNNLPIFIKFFLLQYDNRNNHEGKWNGLR